MREEVQLDGGQLSIMGKGKNREAKLLKNEQG